MVDAHCHLNDPLYQDNEISELIKKAKGAGVFAFICNGSGNDSSQRCIDLSKKFDGVNATVGIHPEDEGDFIGQEYADIKKRYLQMAQEPKVVAIGECGLDYTEKTTLEQRKTQIELLRFNIDLARETSLPLVVHCRNAFDDIFEYIDYPLLQMHCFTGNEEQMRNCIERGWYISFGGIVTFKKSHELRRISALVPENRLLIETDSPYLSPEPNRGSRNEPANVKIVAETIAVARGVSVDQIDAVTSKNALDLFEKISAN